ncbi:uncharacterized protein LOC124930338 [Impatiens glandulifera]|uniref:uncharacterized protein LOC124930338 n=1 Tax=Impatiens glandulifera TaxID=253017 RepID=UPI001FB04FD1|nr:uncharacterized protein LOC124930338 [Impatiens glandulifera]
MIEINYDECDGALRIEDVNVDGEKEKKEGKDDEVEEEGKNVEDGKDDEVKEDKGHFERKKRKNVSKAHTEFIEVIGNDGNFKYQCIYCKSLLSRTTTGTTSHLWNHLKRCVQKKMHTEKQKILQFQPIKSKFEMNHLSEATFSAGTRVLILIDQG